MACILYLPNLMWALSIKISWLLSFCTFLIACSGGRDDQSGDSSSLSQPPSVELVSDREDLIVFTQALEAEAIPQAIDLKANESVVAPILKGLSSQLILGNENEDLLSQNDVSLVDQGHSKNSVERLLDSWSARLFAKANFPIGVVPRCQFESPFEGLVECTFDSEGMLIHSNQIRGSGELKIRAYREGQNPLERFELSKALAVGHVMTRPLVNLAGDGASDFVENDSLVEAGGEIFFRAASQPYNYKLYSYKNQKAYRISNLRGDLLLSDGIRGLTVFRQGVVFIGFNSLGKQKLFYYQNQTMTQVSNTAGTQGHDQITYAPVSFNGAVYFWANNQNGAAKLFRFDGESSEQVSNISGDQKISDPVGPLLSLRNALVWRATFQIQNIGLISKVGFFDGNQIKIISLNGDLQRDESPQFFMEVDDSIYWMAKDSSNTFDLYQYSPTAGQLKRLTRLGLLSIASAKAKDSSIVILADAVLIRLDFAESSPVRLDRFLDLVDVREFTLQSGQILAVALNSEGAPKIFRIRGKEISELLSTTKDRTQNDDPKHLVEHGDEVYFWAKNEKGFYKLYRLHGDKIGQVADLAGEDEDDQDFSSNCSASLHKEPWSSTSEIVFARITNLGGGNCTSKLFGVSRPRTY